MGDLLGDRDQAQYPQMASSGPVPTALDESDSGYFTNPAVDLLYTGSLPSSLIEDSAVDQTEPSLPSYFREAFEDSRNGEGSAS